MQGIELPEVRFIRNKSMVYKALGGTAIILLGLAITFFAWNEYNNKFRLHTEEGIDNETFEEIWEAQDFSGIEPRSYNKMISDVHEMSNTIIKAVDGKRWGLIKITEELCNKLILELASVEKHGEAYAGTDRLMEILWRWKEGDYSEGVEDHNYVWRILGGTVGKAYDLQDDIKKKMAEKGFIEN